MTNDATPTGPTVTVIIVTWNGKQFLGPCLDSLLQQTVPRASYDILVVDNASTDGTPEFLAKHHPDVQVIRCAVNTGFAGGCHVGLAAIRTPVAVLINNDAMAAPDFLDRIVAPLKAPDIAATTAKVLLEPRFRRAHPKEAPTLLSSDGPLVEAAGGDDDLVDVINSTGNEVDARGYGRDRGWLAVDRHTYDTDVFGFCGAAAALDTAAVAAVGGFDADYFLYYEDTDLSWRLRLTGRRVVYVPDAVVRHHHAGSSVEGSAVHRFYDERNRLLTLTKDAPAGLAIRAALRFPLTTLSIARTELPQLRQTRTRVRAALSYLRLLPRILRRRAEIGRLATVPRAAVAAQLTPEPAPSTDRYRP